ncbi:Arc family DNA-binding protein [Methanobrevibacter filiformis]|nr:Arc family DNA-binding protein [Methanobrevibacter filiformis]
MTEKKKTNVDLPTDLKKKLKMLAIEEDTTMNSLIIGMIQEGFSKREV